LIFADLKRGTLKRKFIAAKEKPVKQGAEGYLIKMLSERG
jgi:hypothetical protein